MSIDQKSSAYSGNNLECCICLGPIEKGTEAKLDCGHIFTLACIEKWLGENTNCPLCRGKPKEVLTQEARYAVVPLIEPQVNRLPILPVVIFTISVIASLQSVYLYFKG